MSLVLERAQIGLWEWEVRANRSVLNTREYEPVGLPVGAGEVDTETFFERLHPEALHELRASLACAVERTGEFAHGFRIVRPERMLRC